MPLDSSVLALTAHPAPLPDRLEQYSRAVALKNAIGQGQAQQQEAQIRQQQIQQGNLAMKAQQALDSAYKQAYTVDAEGNPALNHEAITKSLSDAGMGHLIPSTIKSFNDKQASKGNGHSLEGEDRGEDGGGRL